jgi:hypothetical protein
MDHILCSSKVVLCVYIGRLWSMIMIHSCSQLRIYSANADICVQLKWRTVFSVLFFLVPFLPITVNFNVKHVQQLLLGKLEKAQRMDYS